MESTGFGHYREFLIILGAAGLIVPLFVRLGINSILGFLLVGFLLSPDVLGSLTGNFPFLKAFVITDPEAISSLGELGVVFLLFLIGLSFPRTALPDAGFWHGTGLSARRPSSSAAYLSPSRWA
jgi:Kef-type K+ transport system membrane component KefB